MCVIASKPAGISISREILERCFEANSDGAGFVAARDGVLHMHKGFFNFEEFYTAFTPYQDAAAVIHFRIKTHGAKNAEMCHPFQVTENLWVAHNGILNIDTSNDPTKSDTWHFVDLVLTPELLGAESRLDSPAFKYLLSCSIGNSKLAFLDRNGKSTIINADKGEYHEGVWYSNQSYKRVRSAGFSADPRHSSSAWYSRYGHAYDDDECCGGATEYYSKQQRRKNKTVKDIPAFEQWAAETLRDFGFDDEEIFEEYVEDNLTDLALDLLIFEAGERANGSENTRKEILASAIEAGEDDDTALAEAADAQAELAAIVQGAAS